MKMYILDENGHVIFEAEARHKFDAIDKFNFSSPDREIQFKTLVLVKAVYKHLSAHVMRLSKGG